MHCIKVKVWTLAIAPLTWVDSWPAALHNLGSGSWLAWCIPSFICRTAFDHYQISCRKRLEIMETFLSRPRPTQDQDQYFYCHAWQSARPRPKSGSLDDCISSICALMCNTLYRRLVMLIHYHFLSFYIVLLFFKLQYQYFYRTIWL